MTTNINKKHKDTLSLLFFIAPFTVLFAVLFIYPLFRGLMLSFTDWNGLNKKIQFIGIQNYIELFSNDKRFINSLAVTFVFTFFNVCLSNIAGLIIALVIEKSVWFKNLLRTLFFLPYVLSLVVVGFSWRLLYTEVLPSITQQLGLNIFNIDYIGSPKYALYSIVFMSVWYGIGYYLIIYIAGLQSIDKSILEAASIDGAFGWRRFRNIILPLLMPAVTICIFTSISGSLKIFDAVFVLTSGGPGYATETIALNIYNEAFGSANLYGYGMAKAVILALIILVISYFQLKFFKEREVEV